MLGTFKITDMYIAIKITNGVERIICEAISLEYLIDKYGNILLPFGEEIIFREA